MYEICKHVNFMFQFGIIIDYLCTFQKIPFFFSKYPVFGYLPKPWVNTWVNTQKIFTYPLGIYPPHITTYSQHFLHISMCKRNGFERHWKVPNLLSLQFLLTKQVGGVHNWCDAIFKYFWLPLYFCPKL